MVMTIRSKSEIIFCTKNKSVSYYVSEWILLIMTVLVTAMAWSVFISSKQDVFFNITGTHLMLGAIAFSFVGIRSLAQRIVNAKIIKRKVKAHSKKSGVGFISQVSRDKNKRTIRRRNQNI